MIQCEKPECPGPRGFSVLLFGGSAKLVAQPAVAPDLGLAHGYAVLGTNAIATTGTVTCTTSTINGRRGHDRRFDLQYWVHDYRVDRVSLPLSGPGVVTDFGLAYDSIDVMNPDSACLPMPTASGPVPPGVYCSAASTTFGAGVILTLTGSATDVWVFKVGALGSSGALTGNGFQVVMGGAAQACNVYWRTACGRDDDGFDLHGNRPLGKRHHRDRRKLPRASPGDDRRDVDERRAVDLCGLRRAGHDHGHQGLHPEQCRDGADRPDLHLGRGDRYAAERGRGLTGGVHGGRRPSGGDLPGHGDGAGRLHGEPDELRECGAGRQLHDHQHARGNTNTITVLKDFLPNSLATVPVALTCTSGSGDRLAAERAPRAHRRSSR